MNILEELKLSKRQNNNKRYDYLCKQFNVVDYAIKLEKYTIKLQQENKILKENAENNDKVVDKVNWENQLLKKEIHQLKEQLESSEKARKEAIKYLYEHSQYVDEYGIHYIKENEYCVDYLLDILDIDKGE